MGNSKVVFDWFFTEVFVAPTTSLWWFEVPYPKTIARLQQYPSTLFERLGLRHNVTSGILDESDAPFFAALVQFTFEAFVLRYVEFVMSVLKNSPSSGDPVDGIVITGGCALNVKANDLIRLHSEFRHLVSTHVPSAPGDNGLPIGAAWKYFPPLRPPSYGLALGGPFAFDKDTFDPMHIPGAHLLEDDANEIAQLFTGGSVVAVIRGRTEVGPRALGHRSLLAYPDTIAIKEKMNAIKARAWYRPVAPVCTGSFAYTILQPVRRSPSETADQIPPFSSPYMSFAPEMNDQFRADFPAVLHLDGTARIQTVDPDENPWLHALLEAVGERFGAPILGNTSLNLRGLPIVNRYQEALVIYTEQPLIHALVLEQWYVERTK